MTIGTCVSEKGKIRRGELCVAVDPVAGPIRIPVAIANGIEDGPTAFVTAGVHGDEVNGIAVVQRFLGDLDPKVLRGTIISLPLINTAGFGARQRTVLSDGRDLNRCFPGDPSGSVSEQIAHSIFSEVIARCDFGVDVHDSGRDSVLLPHPRAHIRNDSGGYDRSRMKEIAAFGTDIIMLCRGMEGVMTIEAGRHLGIPAFTVEVGGAMILWEEFIHLGVAGLRNLLVHRGMLEAKMVLPAHQYVLPGEDDIAIKAPMEGVLRTKVLLGQAVSGGDDLAEICDPITGESQEIVADVCGVVHDLNVHGKVDEGDDVVGVLAFTKCPQRGMRPTSEHVEVLDIEASDRVELRPSEVFEKALALSF
jgi:uncharacterized protein